jgi:hypothetical protein
MRVFTAFQGKQKSDQTESAVKFLFTVNVI